MAVDQLTWLAMGVFGTLMLFAWLFVEKRVVFTGSFSAAIWGWLAITGGTVEKITLDGTRVATDLGPVQYICMGISVLSLLAVILYYFDHYPPGTDRPEDSTV